MHFLCGGEFVARRQVAPLHTGSAAANAEHSSLGLPVHTELDVRKSRFVHVIQLNWQKQTVCAHEKQYVLEFSEASYGWAGGQTGERASERAKKGQPEREQRNDG